ncbi:MAG TPA: GAF domain-containing protein [Burkholderiaceae bacterium]|nr:GAF domain-containing protein [Burkholderiaceae bacterium]
MNTPALTIDDIRPCLEGAVPGVMATCDAAGLPNVAYLSQVDYVDSRHVALSFQFFNTTRHNVLQNPQVQILLVHPVTGALYRVRAHYLRTETAGALFERMKARLSGIASHSGMSGVFQLRGADIYAVDLVEHVPKTDLPPPASCGSLLAGLRRCSERLAECNDLESLFEALLENMEREFGIAHSMLLMFDAACGRLYTVASRGYDASGVGSEVPLGEGVIGVAARERAPVRISHLTAEYTYSRAVRDSLARQGLRDVLETGIPWPGLPEPHSQLAVPVLAGPELVGVLFAESPQDLRFSYDDEDALVALAAQLGPLIRHFQAHAESPEEYATGSGPLAAPVAVQAPASVQPSALQVRYYPADGSIFFDAEYIIKGVAGSVLWTLLQEHDATGRDEFTNRELRLDPRVRLPDVSDNLEARLVLLRQRLAERASGVALEKAGRGRLRLVVSRPIALLEVCG